MIRRAEDAQERTARHGGLHPTAAILLGLGKRTGAWLFGLALSSSVIWALWEVGFDFWALMPRLMLPVAFGI